MLKILFSYNLQKILFNFLNDSIKEAKMIILKNIFCIFFNITYKNTIQKFYLQNVITSQKMFPIEYFFLHNINYIITTGSKKKFLNIKKKDKKKTLIDYLSNYKSVSRIYLKTISKK